MSMHKKPLTRLEEEGLRAHGLPIGTPSQLSDVFRHGVAWAAAQDWGEVQRLLKDYRALLAARRFPDNDEGDFDARIRDQELRRIDAALAASTGQEV